VQGASLAASDAHSCFTHTIVTLTLQQTLITTAGAVDGASGSGAGNGH
jgi:hypothetical protein